MKQDLFKYLPSEIKFNIISRLPVVNIIQCKCVSKPWLSLVESPDFAKFHLSKSVPGLAVFRNFSSGLNPWAKPYKFFEFKDMAAPEEIGHRCSEVFSFNLPRHDHIHSSVNGLLLLSDTKENPLHHFICNPITRDFIMLPRPHKRGALGRGETGSFGFGVSRTSGQYKVVTMFQMNEALRLTKCKIYTLGAGGSWRDYTEPLHYIYSFEDEATFLNGNLHWKMGCLRDNSISICCFDLETEVFSIFSAPPDLLFWETSLVALEDTLILCDYVVIRGNKHDFWFMEEYGNDKSWTKKFTISTEGCYGMIGNSVLCPIKVFKDRHILLAQPRGSTLCYDRKPNSSQPTDVVELYRNDRICTVSYTPSFISVFFHSQPSYWRM